MSPEPTPARERLAGVGLEVVSIERFAAAVERRGERLLERLFLPDELRYARSRPRSAVHLAARFAAKCAARRVLRQAGRRAPGFRELEIRRGDDGEPSLAWPAAGGDASLVLRLSLAHERGLALASVLASRGPAP